MPKHDNTETAWVIQLTKDGDVRYPCWSSEEMQVRFSKTRKTVYLPDGTVLTKVKGGHMGGVLKGQYQCQETGDMFNLMVSGAG